MIDMLPWQVRNRATHLMSRWAVFAVVFLVTFYYMYVLLTLMVVFVPSDQFPTVLGQL